MFVALRPEVLKQLDGAILFFNDANGGGGGRQDIHVADFACTLANAPEIAEQVALAASGIRRQSAEGGFEAADPRILGNITIGERAQIGANAVVLKDVPADHVAVGVPATIRPARSSRIGQD